MIFFHGNLMEFFISCLWKFCLIYGTLAFSNGNTRFESESPAVALRRTMQTSSWLKPSNWLLTICPACHKR